MDNSPSTAPGTVFNKFKILVASLLAVSLSAAVTTISIGALSAPINPIGAVLNSTPVNFSSRSLLNFAAKISVLCARSDLSIKLT